MTSAEDVAPLTTHQMNLIYDAVVKAGYQGLADHWIARAEAAEAESARLRKALKPFSDAVYNDNGDVTITPCSTAQYMSARAALKP